jgi:hypothetical protein
LWQNQGLTSLGSKFLEAVFIFAIFFLYQIRILFPLIKAPRPLQFTLMLVRKVVNNKSTFDDLGNKNPIFENKNTDICHI